MIGKIIKIDQRKQSFTSQVAYIRVHLMVGEVSSKERTWAKTDLVSSFRNYKKWKDLLEINNILGGLKLKDKETVDSDSPVYLIQKEPKEPEEAEEVIEQFKLF